MLTPLDQRILRFVEMEARPTSKDIADALDVPEREVEIALSRLADLGFLDDQSP
jgi:Mn-dependent DtxR family transcriptional regulator